jgi:epoxyqueuosine reductase
MKQDSTTALTSFFRKMDVDVFAVADMGLYGKEFIGLDAGTGERYPFALSFGLVLSKGLLGTLSDGPTPFYQHHYRQLNYRLDMVAYFLSREIEREGYSSLPFAASQLVDWQNQRAHISHKRIGEISGLGWIGRNNLLVNPSFGAQVRYNTVLTDMPLTPGVPIASGCGECGACEEVCPASAIGSDPSVFDHHGCFAMLKRFKNERNLGHHICGLCVKACKGKR